MTIKNNLFWLLQAAPLHIGADNNYAAHINVINGVGYATDKHRMHVCPVDVADGCYDPLTLNPVDASTLVGYTDFPALVKKLSSTPDNLLISTVYKDFAPHKPDRRILSFKYDYCHFDKLYVDQALNGDKKAVLNIVGVGTKDLGMFGTNNKQGWFYIAGLKMPLHDF